MKNTNYIDTNFFSAFLSSLFYRWHIHMTPYLLPVLGKGGCALQGLVDILEPWQTLDGGSLHVRDPGGCAVRMESPTCSLDLPEVGVKGRREVQGLVWVPVLHSQLQPDAGLHQGHPGGEGFRIILIQGVFSATCTTLLQTDIPG